MLGLRHLAATAGFALAALCAPPVAAEDMAPAAIPGATEIAFKNSTGEAYRLLLWQPEQPAPEAGYPVLYSFDGDDSFGLLTDMARQLNAAAFRAGVAPVAVAAIAYPRAENDPNRRIYDMTPTAESYDMPERPNGRPWPTLGGGDAFLALLGEKVKPLVRSRIKVNADAETLFGHSLGGLMVLEELVTEPGAFDCYAASSPSIWVNDRKILADIDAFLDSGRSEAAPLRLALSVGSEEETLDAWDRNGPWDVAAREKWMRGNAMVTNAHRLKRMIEARSDTGVTLTFREYAGRGHHTAKPEAATDALLMALSCAAPAPDADNRLQ